MLFPGPTLGPLGSSRGAPALPPAVALSLDNTGNGALTTYPVRLDMTARNFDFSLLDTHGENLRFLDSDGTTVLAHWTEYFSKAAQLATVWIQQPSIGANGTKTVYYQPDVIGAAETSQMLGSSSDDFGGPTEEWAVLGDHQSPSVYGEHGIIANGWCYGTDLATKATKFDPISGALIWSATIGTYCPTAPALDSHGKLHYYTSAGMYRVRDDGSSATIEQTYTTGFTGSSSTMPDYEATAYDADNDQVFCFDTSGHLLALRTTDYNLNWTNSTVNGNNAGGYGEQSTLLIAPDGGGTKWLWFYETNTAKLWKINLATGVGTSLTLANGYSLGRYTGPLYAADQGKLYVPSPGNGAYLYRVDPTTLTVDTSWPIGPLGPNSSWYVWRPICYRAGIVYLAIANATASPTGHDTSRYLAIDTSGPSVKWTNNDQISYGTGNSCIIQSLVDDTYVYATSHDYQGTDVAGNPDCYLWVLRQSDGVQACTPIRLRVSTASCVPFAIGAGRIMAGLWFSRGYQAIKLRAAGAAVVNVPWKGDTYRTGDVSAYFSGALAGSALNGQSIDGAKWSTVNSGQVNRQGQSLMVKGINPAAWAGLLSVATFARSGFAVRARARLNFNLTSEGLALQFTDAAGSVHPVSAELYNGQARLKYDQSGSVVTLADGAPALDAWHSLELKAQYPGTLRFDVDDTLTLQHPGTWSTAYDNEKIGLVTDYPDPKCDAEFDAVMIRPYSFPEPEFFVKGRDLFTGTNGTALTAHTPLVGGPWTSLAGTWTLNGSGAAVNSANGWEKAVMECNAADVTLTLDVLTAGSADFACGIVFRAVDASNYWQWAAHKDVPGAILYEWVGGSPTERGRIGSGTSLVVSGTKLRLRVVCSGALIKASMLGQTVVYSTAATGLAATKHGLTEFRDGSSFNAQNLFSNFLVRAL